MWFAVCTRVFASLSHVTGSVVQCPLSWFPFETYFCCMFMLLCLFFFSSPFFRFLFLRPFFLRLFFPSPLSVSLYFYVLRQFNVYFFCHWRVGCCVLRNTCPELCSSARSNHARSCRVEMDDTSSPLCFLWIRQCSCQVALTTPRVQKDFSNPV